jgi:hypothetical protein
MTKTSERHEAAEAMSIGSSVGTDRNSAQHDGGGRDVRICAALSGRRKALGRARSSRT